MNKWKNPLGEEEEEKARQNRERVERERQLNRYKKKRGIKKRA